MSLLFPTTFSKVKWIASEFVDTTKYIVETTKKEKPSNLGADLGKKFMAKDEVKFTLKAFTDKYDTKAKVTIQPNLSDLLTINSWSLVANKKTILTASDPYEVLQEVGRYVLMADETMLSNMKSWLK